MMTGTVKQPQTAPPGPARPTGTGPRGAAAKAQLLLSPAGRLAPHTRHHQIPRCPQMEDFWPLPAGPSQSLPSLLEGGVSATNSSEIPSCAPRSPEICSQGPFSRDPAPSLAQQQLPGSPDPRPAPGRCRRRPLSPPPSPCPTASPAQAREGEAAMAKPNPGASSLGSCKDPKADSSMGAPGSQQLSHSLFVPTVGRGSNRI